MQLGGQSLARSTAWLVGAMWALAMVALGALYVTHQQNAIEENQTQLNLLLKEVTRSIKARVNMYALGSTALRAGLLSDDDSIVKPKKVRSFIKHRNTEKEFVGSRGFGFIRPLTQTQVSKLLEQNENDPLYPKSVISLSDEPNTSDDVFLVEAIEPVAKNKAALGLDIASEPSRKLAATTSAGTGLATLTAPLNLTQVSDPNSVGFLLLTPVYTDGPALQTAEERRARLIGWTYSAFVIEELLTTAQLHTEMMSLNITDISDPFSPKKVFANTKASTAEHLNLSVSSDLELFGRTWRIIANPTETMTNSFSRRQIHWAELAVFGILLTIACVGLYFFLTWSLRREKNRKDDLTRLEESEKRWHDMANSLPQLVWTCDKNGHCDYLSTRWEQYTGIPSEKQLGDKWLAQVHPDDKKELIKHWMECTQAHKVFSFEFRIRRFDGEYRWFDTRATPVFDDAGNVKRWVGSNTDIQIQKEAQYNTLHENNYLEALVEERTRELSNAERKTKKILDTVPLLIGYWDTTLHNVFANHAYEDWFGIARHKLPGMKLSDLLPSAAYQKALPKIKEVFRGIPPKFLNKFPDLNGNGERYGLVNLVPDEINGNVVGFFVCMLDVSELQKAREAAFASSAAKSRFMATIAHEIRNPLNGVLGSASILLDDLPDGEMRSSILEIKDSAKSMRVILDDLLDMTAFESGRLTLETIPFDLQEVGSSSAPLYLAIAKKKNVEFEMHITPESEPIKLLGDPTRFNQILQNLISNAVKFTSVGKISCHIKMEKTDLEHCLVEIKVKDTGIGIPASKIANLFTPFVQVDASNFREFGGSGLGLSITKSLVEAMGGDITVQSQVGHGTEMEVCIPFKMDSMNAVQGNLSTNAAKDSPPQTSVNQASTKSLQCLVVDDMALNRKIFKHILQRDKHEVDLADSGKAALDRCKLKKYDLIISDIDMPDMNGYEFADHLRKSKSDKNRDTPIIACSGFATVSDIRKALSHGMNGHLAKPLDPDTVRVEISRWMNEFTLENL